MQKQELVERFVVREGVLANRGVLRTDVDLDMALSRFKELAAGAYLTPADIMLINVATGTDIPGIADRVEVMVDIEDTA